MKGLSVATNFVLLALLGSVFAYTLVGFVMPDEAYACAPRSKAQRMAFVRANPCPADGSITGVCKGYVVDHKRPLCAGGADTPENMQWQTYQDGLAKDVRERALCRKLNGSEWLEDLH